MSAPTVCAIIPTFNRAHFIGETLDSLLAQTRPLDQIIVIDDGSTDNTKEVVAAYSDKVTYLHKENGGKAAALNFAQPHCTCDYIWFCDDDDIALPNGLAALTELIDETLPDLLLGCAAYMPEKKGQKPLLYGGRRRNEPSVKIGYLEGMPWVFMAMLVKRECLEKVGGWDEAFIRGEDRELAIRLTRSFCSCKETDAVIYLYRLHQERRGSKEEEILSGHVEEKALEYDRRTIKRVQETYELEEFLPTFAFSWDEERKKRAMLLEKGTILFKNGLFKDGIKEVSRALDILPNVPLSLQERDAVSFMSLNAYVWDLLHLRERASLEKLKALGAKNENGYIYLLSLCRAPFNHFLRTREMKELKRYVDLLGVYGVIRRFLISIKSRFLVVLRGDNFLC